MENKLIFEKDSSKDWGIFYRVYSENSTVKYVKNDKVINNKDCNKVCTGFILSYPQEKIYRFEPYCKERQQFEMECLSQIVDFLKELNKR